METGGLITDSALDFRASLPGGGTLLALDLGTQTIGTAFCDATRAGGLPLLERR